MPAVTTRLERTNEDIRKGRKTGFPVSEIAIHNQFLYPFIFEVIDVPGCSVESTICFARHSSGDISFVSPFLYETINFFALSKPVGEMKSILYDC